MRRAGLWAHGVHGGIGGMTSAAPHWLAAHTTSARLYACVLPMLCVDAIHLLANKHLFSQYYSCLHDRYQVKLRGWVGVVCWPWPCRHLTQSTAAPSHTQPHPPPYSQQLTGNSQGTALTARCAGQCTSTTTAMHSCAAPHAQRLRMCSAPCSTRPYAARLRHKQGERQAPPKDA